MLNSHDIDNSNLICTMTGQQYRSAFACKATKDVRYYLDGIFVSGEHSQAVATNGHMLYYTDIEAGDLIKDVIFEAVKIPNTVSFVTISEYSDGDSDVGANVLLTLYGKSNQMVSKYICKVIDGRYPDYVAIIPDPTETEVCFNRFSFDALYLAKLQIIFGKSPVTFYMKANTRCASIESSEHENMGHVILMPCKV